MTRSEATFDSSFLPNISKYQQDHDMFTLHYPSPAYHYIDESMGNTCAMGAHAVPQENTWKGDSIMVNPTTFSATPGSDTYSDPKSSIGVSSRCSYDSLLSLTSPQSGDQYTFYPAKNSPSYQLENRAPSFERRGRQKIVKPLVATIFWEEENTTCYQVKANDIVVSRRESDNYVNGTKLLNATGMSRGRRDGILKSERGRSVVRNGSMNLKGVWIPFNRALEIARNEGLKELLFPLFIDDILRFYNEYGLELQELDLAAKHD